MHNNLLQLKFKERLNKLASLDYDNIDKWLIAEAFNKVQTEWTRTQLQGLNQKREGAESSRTLFDDLQVLLQPKPVVLKGRQLEEYFLTEVLPADYLYYSRLDVSAKSDCCPPRRMCAYLAEQSDLNDLLADDQRRPSFDWGETIFTMGGNTLQVYRDGFTVEEVALQYFRKPRLVSFAGYTDPVTGLPSVESHCEFKDDIAEILVDLAVAVLAGDTENFNQMSRAKASAQATT